MIFKSCLRILTVTKGNSLKLIITFKAIQDILANYRLDFQPLWEFILGKAILSNVSALQKLTDLGSPVTQN